MVTAQIKEDEHIGRIILQPNYSWTWRYNLYLLYTLIFLSIVICTGFLMLGAWMIIPYSAVEMLVLASCMYYCIQQCNKQEVITVTEENVRIEKGIRSVLETWDYQRFWSTFLVQPAKHPWDPQRVSIRSHGKELELGSFLSQQDKIELISQLKRVIPI